LSSLTINKTGRAFVVRPFNIKENKKGEKLDFEEVHKKLITPVIEHFGLSGGTTGEFVEQGNIRSDMFCELLVADLVIVDISIHNANVFYELGIRHALKDQYTVLIKAENKSDTHIFDLKSDRYMSYNPDDPAASIEDLKKVVGATLKSEKSDSPVFQLLPNLETVDPANVMIVPHAFREDVEVVYRDGDINDFERLLEKATGEPWEKEGLRLIGQAQFDLKAHEQASATWECVRQFDIYDPEANQRLATCYQKLRNYTLSDQAAERALKNCPSDWDRAETHALIASNQKTCWRRNWEKIGDLRERQQDALRSPLLKKSYHFYHTGFEQHRSHYYSGLNAVAMLSIQVELAKLHPNVWARNFKNERRADIELEEMEEHLVKLIAATELAIDSSIQNYPEDNWASPSEADLMLLTSKDPIKVKHRYQQCIVSIKDFTVSSVRNQVHLYQTLGLFEENVRAALEIIGEDNDL